MLSLHQELLLLAINDQGDIEFTAGTSTFRLAFVGACIITLEQDGYLECSLDKVRVIATNTAPDPTLALVLTKINESPSAQRLRYWLSALQEDFEMLMKLTLKSLCDLGVLTIEESRFFWVLSSRRYPIADGKEKKEAKLRIFAVLFSSDTPSAEDSVLIGLARTGGLLEAFLTTSEIANLETRIEEVRNLDKTAGLVEKAIQEEQEAIARAMLASPYPV
ncbi:MAG: GOLPH3/VPS74 family protein [Luminiphilus sp.]